MNLRYQAILKSTKKRRIGLKSNMNFILRLKKY